MRSPEAAPSTSASSPAHRCPQQVVPALASPIQPGHIGSGSNGVPWNFDAQGYVQLTNDSYHVAAALQGQDSALFVATTPGHADQQTLFAVGTVGDPAHPARGLLCEDGGAAGSGLLASCALTGLANLSVDTINASLYGANAPFEDARRPYIERAIAARLTDLMCIVEVNRDSDKTAIAQAAQAQFPYMYLRADHARDAADGSRRPPMEACPRPATTAPCAGRSEHPGRGLPVPRAEVLDDGRLDRSHLHDQLPVGAVPAALSPLLSKQPRCWDCMAYYLVSELPIRDGQSACTQQKEAPFAFEGMTPSMILSHYPLKHTQALILPATGFRRAVLYAQVQLDADAFDFYCAQLSSPLIGTGVPYTGDYGQGPSANGWQNEQDLQSTRVISFITKTSGATRNRAIIAGDWHSSEQVLQTDGGVPVAC